MPWKAGPALALCLALAWPQGAAASDAAGDPGREALSLEGGPPLRTIPDGRLARRALLAELPPGAIRRALSSTAAEQAGEPIPPEPPREAAGRKRPPWYRTRTAVILMVVAGAALVGSTALNSLREDS
jgi:hypothetical protein